MYSLVQKHPIFRYSENQKLGIMSFSRQTFLDMFRSTSTWEEYDKAMKIHREQWMDNQYPESWSSPVASHDLEKIIREGKNKNSKLDVWEKIFFIYSRTLFLKIEKSCGFYFLRILPNVSVVI